MLREIILICPAVIAFGALLVYGEDVVEGSGVQEEGLDIHALFLIRILFIRIIRLRSGKN